ncbi:MAG: hypothetical protein Mars2KO_26660 [Maribacter sp.]
MTTKERLYAFCEVFVKARLTRIHRDIDQVQEALASETKSSAGDKHETGRAMLQLEREKLGQQLKEAEKMNQILVKVPVHAGATRIGLGSWVKTSKANYYLGISAGAYTENEETIFCISMATPIAKALFGKSVGDTAIFNDTTLVIEQVM